MSSSSSWRVSGSAIRRSCICSAERRISGSDIKRSDIAWKREVMSFIAVSWATWMRTGWLAAAATASAWARTISIPLQPRHSPFRPQWQSCGRSRSSAAWSSERSIGAATLANLRGFGLPRVHGFDLVVEALRDHLAFHVLLQRQLAVGFGEVVRQERVLLDRLPLAEMTIDTIDGLLDPSLHGRLVHALLFGRIPVGNDEGGHIGLAFSDDHRAHDQGIAEQRVLDLLRGHVLAARGLEERLLAVGDLEEAIAVDLTDVPGVEPAVFDDLGRGVRLVVIAAHVARALDEDLSVVRDLQLDAGKRSAHGEKAMLVQRVRADTRRGLRQTPAVEDRNAERPEEFLDLAREAGPAADEEPQATARQPRPQSAQHEPLSQSTLSA